MGNQSWTSMKWGTSDYAREALHTYTINKKETVFFDPYFQPLSYQFLVGNRSSGYGSAWKSHWVHSERKILPLALDFARWTLIFHRQLETRAKGPLKIYILEDCLSKHLCNSTVDIDLKNQVLDRLKVHWLQVRDQLETALGQNVLLVSQPIIR